MKLVPHPTSHHAAADLQSDEIAATRSVIEPLRQKLSQHTGKQYWRSLEELADSPEFHKFVEAEFPSEAPVWSDAIGRRRFLQLMAGSMALAGMSACTRQPSEKIYPYVKAPEQIVPGEPLYYATAMPLVGMGTGLLVESHMGRPTKIEGNPDHPASVGATDVLAQASVLTLYDPDRSQVITYAGEIRPWRAFVEAMAEQWTSLQAAQGKGLCILTGAVTSPTLTHQLRTLMQRLPQARWYQYEPLARDGARRGARLAYGRDVDVQYRFEQADVVVSLDADFLMQGPGRVRYTRDLSRRRQPGNETPLTRLYVVESTPSNTGAVADHRLPLRPGEVRAFSRALAARLGLGGSEEKNPRFDRWVDVIARDLQAHRGRSLIVAGDFQPASVHALAQAMNHVLGNVGNTVVCTEPVESQPEEHLAALQGLSEAIDAGAVSTLLILGTNPILTAPVDLRFAERLARVPLRIHLGLYDDETARLCHWHVSEAHYLEAWSDVRGFDGTASIIQPLIAPLYDGHTAHEIVDLFGEGPRRNSYDIVRAYWQEQWGAANFESRWRRAVHDGVIAGSALGEQRVTLSPGWQTETEIATEKDAEIGTEREQDGLDLVIRPDPSLFDGSFANNAWLQELPRPMTKLTWDNAALVAPATAARLGLVNEQVVKLSLGEHSLHAPIWIVPGQAADVVTVHLGHGRTRAGRVGNGSGFNAYLLRTSAAPWSATGLVLSPTSDHHPLACTQHHHAMEGREPVRVQRHAGEAHHASSGHESGHGDLSLHPPFAYTGYAWGMSIDLNRCIGCNACTIACQSENNIAVVGKEDVRIGREMHWIRVDRYFEGEPDNPATYHQPVPCMHCERAPCEPVCPVNATVHGDEGLNEMVYNRCVGTRYCANNCPYKVRRFNFRLHSVWHSEPLKMLMNPDVTVRSRGVMEKCTYCVQRINYARIRAERDNRTVRDGEVVTACQSVCPAEAIVFGDINDKSSAVSARRNDPRHYALLAELGTQPRTTYLGVVRNPNPELDEA